MGAPTRDPVQALDNLNPPQRRVGGAIFGNFLHIIRTTCQLSAHSVKISKKIKARTGSRVERGLEWELPEFLAGARRVWYQS